MVPKLFSLHFMAGITFHFMYGTHDASCCTTERWRFMKMKFCPLLCCFLRRASSPVQTSLIRLPPSGTHSTQSTEAM